MKILLLGLQLQLYENEFIEMWEVRQEEEARNGGWCHWYRWPGVWSVLEIILSAFSQMADGADCSVAAYRHIEHTLTKNNVKNFWKSCASRPF